MLGSIRLGPWFSDTNEMGIVVQAQEDYGVDRSTESLPPLIQRWNTEGSIVVCGMDQGSKEYKRSIVRTLSNEYNINVAEFLHLIRTHRFFVPRLRSVRHVCRARQSSPETFRQDMSV